MNAQLASLNLGMDQQHAAPRNSSKTSPALLAAAFAGMMLPHRGDAQVVSEPPDFGNTFATRTNLGSGILLFNGSVDTGTDPNDYFQLSGLSAGSTFSFD